MLRVDLFKTRERDNTRFFAVRDTLTPPDPTMDAYKMDTRHCRQGRLGLGFHFLITVTGVIELGRHHYTVGSHSRDYDALSVGIGLVGGVNEEGDRVNTRTPEQSEALADLLSVLEDIYPSAEVHDRPFS